MRIHLLPALFASTAFAALPSSVTIWYWALQSSSPSPLATIAYDPLTLNSSTTAYTPPAPPKSINTNLEHKDLIRIGLYDPKIGQKSWSGTVTSAASFDPAAQHQISLVLSRRGEPFSVSFHAFTSPLDPREERRRQKREERAKKREEEAIAAGKVPKSKAGRSKKKDEKGREQPIVEITMAKQGKRPVLNTPVVVNEQGQVEGKEEKTFLQKYWWAIAIFLVMQLVAGGAGGGEEEKK